MVEDGEGLRDGEGDGEEEKEKKFWVLAQWWGSGSGERRMVGKANKSWVGLLLGCGAGRRRKKGRREPCGDLDEDGDSGEGEVGLAVVGGRVAIVVGVGGWG